MGLRNWDAYNKYVEGGLKDGQFSNGQFVLIAAGPPHLSNMGSSSSLGADNDVVYPIGLTQNIAISSNRAISRIFEIGSERSYFIPGRTVGQLTLSRVYYDGPSLLRALWAYYRDATGIYKVDALLDGDKAGSSITAAYQSLFPWNTEGGTHAGLHNVRIPPGYDNLFINLASDLFTQPIGLLLLIRDSEEQNLGAVYLEQCYVPTHTWAVDSQGLIIQESVGIQFERYVPIKLNAVQLINGLLGNQENPFATNPDVSIGASNLG